MNSKLNEFEIIKEKLNNSSVYNRNYIIFFLSFITYIFLTTLSIKDIQLLFPFLGVNLPILNINLSIDTFIVIAPLLVTLFYINILLNLSKHIELIEIYKVLIKKNNLSTFNIYPNIPFMVDYAFLHNSSIFKKVTYIFVLIYPIIVLSIILIKFFAYQNFIYTFIHFILFLFSIYFVFNLNFQIYFNKLLEFQNRTFFIKNVEYFNVFIAGIIGFVIMCYFFLPNNIKVTYSDEIPLPNTSKYAEYLKNNNIKNDNTLNTFPKLNLSNRNLKNAKFEQIFMPFTIFDNSNLQSIDVESSNLQYTSFQSANIRYGSFVNSNLNNSNFKYSNLQSAHFSSNLSSAHFEFNNISKSKFHYCDFNNTTFSYCYGYKTDFDQIKNLNKSNFINCLILDPLSDYNISFYSKREIDFFKNNRFEDFDSWFKWIKIFLLQRPKEYVQIGINYELRTNYKVYYKIKDIVNFLYSLKDTKYKVQAKNTLLKIQKFWIENNDTKMLELLTDDIKNFIGNYKKLK